MSFIGLISKNEDYDFIKSKINSNASKLNLIQINKENIENMKNIKFETIVACTDISKMENKKAILDLILNNAQYLLINSDVNIKANTLKNNKIKIITYGMNQKATVTASSIKDDEILICFQRNTKNIEGNIIEMQELKIKSENIDNNIYNLLVIVTLNKLYERKIW